jgi:hypothetical protein
METNNRREKWKLKKKLLTLNASRRFLIAARYLVLRSKGRGRYFRDLLEIVLQCNME